MLEKYIYRDDHGTGSKQFALILDDDHMPVCFDTVYELAMSYLKPWERNLMWKLVRVEPVEPPKGEAE